MGLLSTGPGVWEVRESMCHSLCMKWLFIFLVWKRSVKAQNERQSGEKQSQKDAKRPKNESKSGAPTAYNGVGGLCPVYAQRPILL